MRKFGIITMSLFCFTSLLAQNRKEVKEANISHQTEWKYEYSDGEEKKFKVAEYQYDSNGNILLEKTFDEDGTILTYFEYKYDLEGNQVTQLTYNSKSKLEKREEFVYKGKLKTEKKTFDDKGKLKSKKIYEYKTF